MKFLSNIPNPNSQQYLSGWPGWVENREWLKSSAIFRRLPALRRKIADLEQRILELEAMLEESKLRSK